MWLFGTGFPKGRDMLKPAYESIVIAQKPIDLRSALCELKGSLVQTDMSQSGIAATIALSTVSLWLDTLDALSAAESMSTIGTASKTIIDWKTLSCCLLRITPESIIQAHSKGHLSIANASPAIRFFDAELMKLRVTLAPSVAELATSLEPIERLDEIAVGYEPIVLAYKPGGKRTMQVEECRIATDWSTDSTRRGWQGCQGKPGSFGWYGKSKTDGPNIIGRWPANICHDGSDEVIAAFPYSSSGELHPWHDVKPNINGWSGGSYIGRVHRSYGGDTGSAARFFFSAKADSNDRYNSKHPTVKPTALMRWLVRLVVPVDGTVLDPFAGSGSTGAAAVLEGVDSILIEREESYIADIRKKIKGVSGKRQRALY